MERPGVKRTNISYGQLDKVLRSLGFTCRLSTDGPPPARLYQHKESGRELRCPPSPKATECLPYHLVAVRGSLENFGIAVPFELNAELQKAV
jgi:hypothetical protein